MISRFNYILFKLDKYGVNANVYDIQGVSGPLLQTLRGDRTQ